MKRDSGEADRFQLVGNLKLWNSVTAGAGVSCPPTGQLAGTGKMVDCHRTKGLMGMAAVRTYLTCCIHVPHLSAQLSPNPRLPFLCLRPVL